MSQFASRVYLSCRDITRLEVDAIVNAANNSLLGGGGVDGAIHRAAGKQLLSECRQLGGCRDGEAKITKGYNLPAKHVIHTVGPQTEKPEVLSSCYRNSLRLMDANNLHSVAFPCISTGVYGYDKERAAHVALRTVLDYFEENKSDTKVQTVVFALFNSEDKKIYRELLPKYFPGASTEEFSKSD
ncbi:O-acetyl-ADP-ribose deacetylase MACROD2 [Choanephora cucurbitarum]|uniref:O-acetyl-ADP-ribose deacetylase MACROD2 n=1 Tax=Choanephora cucurbitarum TaxID=101091 RepID=A0A1C7N8P9_9FUNG|nr:O-acetyl-ADP-ribose deacetylase MACROD2 [Choanephora cucurbitarum]